MDDLEGMAFIGAIVFAGIGVYKTALWSYHPLFFSWNPGLGFARLSVWLGFLIAAVTVYHYSASDIVSDPQYIFFYWTLGYAVIKWAGQLDPVGRISYRVDVLERRNSVAGFYLGCRILAIALIFSGAMIGEGPGFYVVLGFFGLGWAVLELAIFVLCLIKGWNLRHVIARESDIPKGLLIGAWYLVLGMILRPACAGDFIGWEAGFVDFLNKAGPVLGVFLISLPFRFFSSRDSRQYSVSLNEAVLLILYGLYIAFKFRLPV